MFTVTKQWLDQHKTESGAYTKVQIEALGFSWPPPKGWRGMVIGSEIKYQAVIDFEEGKEKGVKNVTLKTCLQLIKKLNNTELELLSDACKATLQHRAHGQRI